MPSLRYDYAAALLPDYGINQGDLDQLAPLLEAARNEVLQVDKQLYESNGAIPAEKQPLDAGFVEMPERILAAYRSDRQGSELGRILKTAERIRERCDRVVVLGIGGSYMGAKALMDTCCHPFHNEMSRADRGGRPRIYFEGNNVDNDSANGLLDLLRTESTGDAANWAIVVISKSGGTLETAVSFRVFLEALSASVGGDTKQLAELVVPVTGSSGKLFDLATELGCPEIFEVPDGVGGRFSVLSAVGLLPAAIMGLDVVQLLEGAAEMNRHFANKPLGDNVVLDYTGVCHLLETKRAMNLRLLSVWAKSLETVGLWYDQLLAESLGKEEKGATPLTVVNTRDLHSRAQQHQEGARDKFINNVIVQQWRRDALAVPQRTTDPDSLNQIAGRTVPQIMDAAIKGTNQAYADDKRPTADLYLPQVDEFHVGQLLQMLMLATVAEGRLQGINPYGQPGVEKYKIYMKRNLGIG